MHRNDSVIRNNPSNTELLAEIVRIQRSLLESQGVTDLQSVNDSVAQAYEYASIPSDGTRLAIPPGKTVFDFEEGQIIHSAQDFAFEDAGVIGEIREFDDMAKGISGEKLQSLRSFFINTDIICRLKLNNSEGGFIRLDPGLYTSVKSHGFKTLQIETDYSATLSGVASTRSDAFNVSGVRATMERVGERAEAVFDDWSDSYWWSPGLDDTLSGTGLDHTDYQQAAIDTEPYDETTIKVENTSTAANAIDVKLQAAETEDLNWFDIGDSIQAATGSYLAQDDHYIFHVDQEHRFIRVQFHNETNGDTVGMSGELKTGGS